MPIGSLPFELSAVAAVCAGKLSDSVRLSRGLSSAIPDSFIESFLLEYPVAAAAHAGELSDRVRPLVTARLSGTEVEAATGELSDNVRPLSAARLAEAARLSAGVAEAACGELSRGGRREDARLSGGDSKEGAMLAPQQARQKSSTDCHCAC